MMRLITLGFIFISSLQVQASTKEIQDTWDGYNNPFRMDPNFEDRLDVLPTTGHLDLSGLAWPGSYWPNYRGSTAWRWNSDNPQDFRYHSPNLSEAMQMSADEINALSPAEKYDLFMGEYDYPTKSYVWRVTSPRSPTWYGICHGVAPASIHHEEPKTVTMTSKDGVDITFYASDVKGLLAHHYARVSDSKVVQVGKRCYMFGFGCSDINAGSFHIILTNKLGLTHTGFIADIDRGKQVWNHAPVTYETEKLEEFAYKDLNSPTVETRVRMQTKVKYAGSIAPSQNPVIGTELAEYYDREYQYFLDLNAQGEIIGGDWVSWGRPDFVWYQEVSVFQDYWEKLAQIYQASIY